MQGEDRARQVLMAVIPDRMAYAPIGSPAGTGFALAAMLQYASEREAIGRAAGREEMRERIIGDVSGAIPLPGNPRQTDGTRAQGMWDAVRLARSAALPDAESKGGGANDACETAG